MSIVLFILVWAVSMAIGAFGWPQIVGSLRLRQKGFLFPVVFWLAVLVGEFFLVRAFFPGQLWAWGIGTGIAFIMTLGTGKIQ